MSDRPLINIAKQIDILVMTERGGAFGIHGFIHDPALRIAEVSLTLVQDDVRLAASHHSVEDRLIDPRLSSAIEATGAAGIDGGFFLSMTFPHEDALRPGLAVIEATFTWSDGRSHTLRLCFARLQIVTPLPLPATGVRDGTLVGIAMATFNPEPTLFARQVASLREQSHRNWICVISDDLSNPLWLAQIKDAIADDPRFVLAGNDVRLGFYRNFERALALLPKECAFFAPSDQDDIWKPDRLAAGLAVLADADVDCVFSDTELVTSGGKQLSPSLWVHRRERFGSISGLLLANVATGMTMLVRNTIMQVALPFPATPNLTYHDAWIALLAEARGTLHYLPRPLVEYVQHGSNHTSALRRPDGGLAALRHSVKQLIAIISIPLRKSASPDRVRELLVETNHWGGNEAAKLRILASSLAHRLPDFARSRANRRLLALCRRFGLISMLGSRIDWKDRYRQSVGVRLFFGVLIQRIILLYIGRSRQRMAKPGARS